MVGSYIVMGQKQFFIIIYHKTELIFLMHQSHKEWGVTTNPLIFITTVFPIAKNSILGRQKDDHMMQIHV